MIVTHRANAFEGQVAVVEKGVNLITLDNLVFSVNFKQSSGPGKGLIDAKYPKRRCAASQAMLQVEVS